MEESGKCRTYFIVDKEELENIGKIKLLGFYSLAAHNFNVKEGTSKSKVKRLDGFNKNATNIQCWLIGQLAKNDKYANQITGKEIIEFAQESILYLYKLAGLRTILIECKHEKKLIEFYKNHGFEFLQESTVDGLVQMTKIINN
ncbi:MAG: GNAT family acetyltransferase [Clostridium chrysemydis]|uniref:GNAT family acetyltransferase n=1 Tax=Clostridium chrysemydis TaxID=2665504 RepID=UPI003F407EED